jgi:hypothetical protein
LITKAKLLPQQQLALALWKRFFGTFAQGKAKSAEARD